MVLQQGQQEGHQARLEDFSVILGNKVNMNFGKISKGVKSVMFSQEP